MPTPLDEYRARADRWRIEHTKSEQRSRQLGNARLATGLAAVAIAALAIGAGVLSPWWLLLPLAVFVRARRSSTTAPINSATPPCAALLITTAP